MEIHCYGDSHTKYFGESTLIRWGEHKKIGEPKVSERSMVAASAKGFANGPDSRFAYRKFTRLVAEDNPLFVCMNFGLVDADAGIYYRKYVKNSTESVEDDLSKVYQAYVARVVESLPDQTIIFKGLNPSTICIQQYFNNYIFQNITKRVTQENTRKEIAERMKSDPTDIEQHAKNNCIAAILLKEAVIKAGYKYFDIRDTLMDPKTAGLCAIQFLPAQHDNHVVDSLLVRLAHRKAVIDCMNQAVNHV